MSAETYRAMARTMLVSLALIAVDTFRLIQTERVTIKTGTACRRQNHHLFVSKQFKLAQHDAPHTTHHQCVFM